VSNVQSRQEDTTEYATGGLQEGMFSSPCEGDGGEGQWMGVEMGFELPVSEDIQVSTHRGRDLYVPPILRRNP
jgi:hypothetical protein